MSRMFSLASIAHAMLILNNKQVIAYPTEAVFGVGCDPDSKVAILRLLALKQRSIKKGLVLVAANYEQLKPYINDSMLSQAKRNEILSTWLRSPITFIFPAQPTTPYWLTGCFNSLAVRVTTHPLVIKLCEVFGKPLVSTSANQTGLPPCRTISELSEQFGSTLPTIIGETSGCQNPSEIRDAITNKRFR